MKAEKNQLAIVVRPDGKVAVIVGSNTRAMTAVLTKKEATVYAESLRIAAASAKPRTPLSRSKS